MESWPVSVRPGALLPALRVADDHTVTTLMLRLERLSPPATLLAARRRIRR